jgi:hypothetical protein
MKKKYIFNILLFVSYNVVVVDICKDVPPSKLMFLSAKNHFFVFSFSPQKQNKNINTPLSDSDFILFMNALLHPYMVPDGENI